MKHAEWERAQSKQGLGLVAGWGGGLREPLNLHGVWDNQGRVLLLKHPPSRLELAKLFQPLQVRLPVRARRLILLEKQEHRNRN